jgi:hypothetical protein
LIQLDWNALPSHAVEWGLFRREVLYLDILPLSAISPDALAVQEKYLNPIQARIDGGDRPGCGSSIWNKSRHELRATKSFCFSPLACGWVSVMASETHPAPAALLNPTNSPKEKYASFMSLSKHPFSPGSIVRIRHLSFIVIERSTLFAAYQVQ